MEEILCKVCGISCNHPGITMEADQKCSICSGQRMSEAVKINRSSMKEYMEFQMGVGKKGKFYDCLLMYSGGKDSTYLLYKMLGKKRLMAYTFNNPFESKIAIENIEETHKKFHFEHISYAPDSEKFNQIMRVAFLNQKVWKEKGKAAEKTPCTVCTLVMLMSACVYAYRMEIPYVIYGADPKQIDGGLTGGVKAVAEYLYRIVGSETLDDFFGKGVIHEIMVADERVVPKVIYPYIVEGKYEPDKMMELLSDIGVYKGTPETTHCRMYPLLCYYAYKKYGCNFYAHEMAEAVRSAYLTREQSISINEDYRKIFLEIMIKKEISPEEKTWIKESMKRKYYIFAEAPNRKNTHEDIEKLAEYESNIIIEAHEVAKTLGITLNIDL